MGHVTTKKLWGGFFVSLSQYLLWLS